MSDTTTGIPVHQLVLQALDAARGFRATDALTLIDEASKEGGLDSIFNEPRLGGFHRRAIGMAARDASDWPGRTQLVAAITSLAANSGAIPAITVRVGNRGYGRGYQGVTVCTVVISATCPRCNGPRGERRTGRIIEDGAYYYVDNWDNPCRHRDMHADVLVEAGFHPWPGAAR